MNEMTSNRFYCETKEESEEREKKREKRIINDNKKIRLIKKEVENNLSNGFRTIVDRGYSVRISKPRFKSWYTKYGFYLINGQKIYFRDYFKDVKAIKFMAFQVIYSLDNLLRFTKKNIRFNSSVPEQENSPCESLGKKILNSDPRISNNDQISVIENNGKLYVKYNYSMTSSMYSALNESLKNGYLFSRFLELSDAKGNDFFGFADSYFVMEVDQKESEEYYRELVEALNRFSKTDKSITRIYPGDKFHPQYWYKVEGKDRCAKRFPPFEDYFLEKKTNEVV